MPIAIGGRNKKTGNAATVRAHRALRTLRFNALLFGQWFLVCIVQNVSQKSWFIGVGCHDADVKRDSQINASYREAGSL
jgi:hypothetical protein